jgi:hypothetical protein
MHSSTSNSEPDFVRAIPALPWKGIVTAVALLTITATTAWEARARLSGYGPSLNDTSDLWAEQRARVRPDSVVIIGTSRALFDLDLDVLEQGLAARPVQLAIAGSSPYPVLADLADDRSFRGTVILDIVPPMYLAPAGPPVELSQNALKRYREWNHAQRWSHSLGKLLESQVAFLKQEDLTLGQLLKRLPIPDRANARVGPKLPPYFYTVDADRRGRMTEDAAVVGSPLNKRVADGWLPLFTVPPPPSHIPPETFGMMMQQAMEMRFRKTAEHIAAIQSRGGKVVFVRLPVTGPLVEREEQLAPRAATWDRLVRENGVPAIDFVQYADLRAFDCPEWSHLSAADSVEFTRRLVPYLQQALREPIRNTAAATAKAYAAQHREPSS